MPQTEEEHLENQNLDNDDSDRSQPDAEVSFSFLGVRITQANDNYLEVDGAILTFSSQFYNNNCFLFCFVYDFVTFCSSFAFFQLIN